MENVKITPTEELILEVLAARVRLGENVWTFNSRLRTSLLNLSKKGLVNRKSGVVENTELAWLTDAGYLFCFENSGKYSAPIQGKAFKEHQKSIAKKAKKLRKRAKSKREENENE